jgi:hypothetical protein
VIYVNEWQEESKLLIESERKKKAAEAAEKLANEVSAYFENGGAVTTYPKYKRSEVVEYKRKWGAAKGKKKNVETK